MSDSARSVESLQRYAAAFEDAFAARDWSLVGSHFTEDLGWVVGGAAPPFGGMWQGRESVLGAIGQSCDGFDYRFDQRKPSLVAGPTPIPGGVHFTWIVLYSREGLPDFELRGEEWDFFRDGKLEFHREKLWNADEAQVYLGRYDGELKPGR